MAHKPTSQDRVHTIEGVQYTLRFSLKAWAILVDQWKLGDINAAQAHLVRLGESMKVDEIVDVFWAALQSHHPDVSREDAFALADAAGIAQVTEIIGTLLSASTPPPDASAAKKKPGTAAS